MKLFRKIREALTVQPYDPIAEVDASFTASNAEKRARGCPCGGPAEVCTSYPTAGNVRSEDWSCYEHADADGWMWTGDQPAVPQYKTSVLCDNPACIGCLVQKQDPRYEQWMCQTRPRDRKFTPDGFTDDGRPYWL